MPTINWLKSARSLAAVCAAALRTSVPGWFCLALASQPPATSKSAPEDWLRLEAKLRNYSNVVEEYKVIRHKQPWYKAGGRGAHKYIAQFDSCTRALACGLKLISTIETAIKAPKTVKTWLPA